MWLKILKYAVIVARATGLDDKVKGWIENRLNGIEDRVVEVDTELRKGDIPKGDSDG
jgi:hypothetical protein